MNFSSIKQSISEGFKLAQRSLNIFVVYFLFNALIFIHATEFAEKMVYLLIYFPIYLGFLFTIPLFLDKNRRNTLTARDMVTDSLRSLLRLIVPMSLFLIVFVLPLILAFKNNPSFMREVLYEVQKQQQNPKLTDILIPSIMLSLLNFTLSYFSLENKNLFSAIGKSISTILKHPFYLVFILGIVLLQTLSKEVLIFDSVYANIAFMIPMSYIMAIISSINLVYFQDVIQKPELSSQKITIPVISWFYTSSSNRNMLIVFILLTIFYILFIKPSSL